MSDTELVEVDRAEVERMVLAVLNALGAMDAKAPEAYVALMLVVSTVMLGLDELPDLPTINLVIRRVAPVWNQLLSEQAGKVVH